MSPRVPGSYAGVIRAPSPFEACRFFSPACKECGGACCRLAAIQRKDSIPAEQIEMLRCRGVIVENDEYIGLKGECRHFSNGKCLIYPDRPAFCKGFAVGSDACKVVRALMGGEL